MQALFFIFLYFSIIFSLGNISKKFSHFGHFYLSELMPDKEKTQELPLRGFYCN